MAADATNVVVGAGGTVYTCPAAAASVAVPTNIGSAISGSFADAGYVTEDGITLTVGGDTEDVMAWQAYYPVRVLQTSRTCTFGLSLREFTNETAALAFGGGTTQTGTVGGTYAVYTPPVPGTLDLRTIVVEWADAGYTFRAVGPRGIIAGDVEANVARTSPVELPITWNTTPSATPGTMSSPPTQAQLATQPFYIISNHPSWIA